VRHLGHPHLNSILRAHVDQIPGHPVGTNVPAMLEIVPTSRPGSVGPRARRDRPMGPQRRSAGSRRRCFIDGGAWGAAPGWPKSKRVPANETCRDGPDRTGTRRRAPIRCSSSGNSIHTPVSSASAGGTSTRSPSVVSSAGGNATARSRPPGFRPTARTRGGRRRPGGRPGDRCRCARWGSGTCGSACPDSDVPPDRGRQ
jgi:hypothetical protein